MSVFHSNTEMLIDYWRGRAFGGAPMDPADFAPLAPQVFMLGRAGPGGYAFRLTGGKVRDLFDRDLRGVPLMTLWRARDTGALRTALEAAWRRSEPLVAQAHALGDRAMLPVELLFAPLGGHGPERVLGLVQPLAPLARLQGEPAHRLALERLSNASHDLPCPHLRLATLHGQRIA